MPNLTQNRALIAQKALQNKMRKTFQSPVRRAQEQEFALAHASDTDEELYAYMKAQKKKLKKQFTPLTAIGYQYYIQRLGPWNEVMCRINRELAEEAYISK